MQQNSTNKGIGKVDYFQLSQVKQARKLQATLVRNMWLIIFPPIVNNLPQ